MNQASLLFHTGPLMGKGKKLKSETTIIGRSSSCDISIADASLSREHAKIVYENNQWVIYDLGSHNGVKTDNGQVTQLILVNGLKFRLGAIEIEFWDGSGLPVNMNENHPEVVMNNNEEINKLAMDLNETNLHSDNINELKQKRLINSIILGTVIAMTCILFVGVYYLMNKKERPVYTHFITLHTDEDRVVDLKFYPLGQNESFLSPFVVNDYDFFSCDLQNIYLDQDIFLIKDVDIKKPTMSSVLLIRTKSRTGNGSISFYKGQNDTRKLIGVLNIDVVRRPIPEVVSTYMTADLQTKVEVAENLYQQATRFEEDPSRGIELWQTLKNAKILFENGEAKPEIYSKIDDKFSVLNKKIENANISLFKQFDIDVNHRDFNSSLKSLQRVIKINPNDENLYKQKAKIYERRISRILFMGEQQ